MGIVLCIGLWIHWLVSILLPEDNFMLQGRLIITVLLE